MTADPTDAAPAPAPAGQPAPRRARRARSRAWLTGPDKVRNLKVQAALVRRAEDAIDASGLAEWFDARLPEQDNRPTGGRRRVLTTKALLLGLLLLATCEQPMVLRDVARLLNDLHPSTKFRLRIPVTRTDPRGKAVPAVTERMVSRLFNQMTQVIDPSPYSESNRADIATLEEILRLVDDPPDGVDVDDSDYDWLLEGKPTDEKLAELGDENEALRRRQVWRALVDVRCELRRELLRSVLDAGVAGTIPARYATGHTGSYAVDASRLDSWMRQDRRKTTAPWLYPDPDARWRRMKGKAGSKENWYGYWLHGIVRVGEVGGDDVPCLVERIDVTPADADERDAAVIMLARMVLDHDAADTAAGRAPRPRQDLLADRGYSNSAENFLWPVFSLGFTPVFDLRRDQREYAPALLPTQGIVVVDGQPFSPRLPEALRDITPPPITATRAQIAAYQAEIDKRRPFLLRANGGRNDDGSWDFGCGAAAWLKQLRCTRKPRSTSYPYTRPMTYPQPGEPAQVPLVCAQEKVRVTADQLPLWQPLLYGSKEWYTSFNRRNRIEGIFGNVKNDASQNLTRGRFRVMGIAKTSLMAMFVVMAANLRLLDCFELRQKQQQADAERDAAATRQPRPRTRKLIDLREKLLERQRRAQAAARPTPPAEADNTGVSIADALADSDPPGDPPPDELS